MTRGGPGEIFARARAALGRRRWRRTARETRRGAERGGNRKSRRRHPRRRRGCAAIESRVGSRFDFDGTRAGENPSGPARDARGFALRRNRDFAAADIENEETAEKAPDGVAAGG